MANYRTNISEAEVKDEGFGLLIGKFAVQN